MERIFSKNFRNKISFDELLSYGNTLKTDIYKYSETANISDTIGYEEFECENRVFRMLNAYVAEGNIKEWLEHKFGYPLEFTDADHIWYESGHKNPGPDLIDRETGETFEIKCGNFSFMRYRFDKNYSHNATYVIYYDRYANNLWLMNYKTKRLRDCTLIAENYFINLPFIND